MQSKDTKKCSNEDAVETRSKVKVPVVTTSTVGVLEKSVFSVKVQYANISPVVLKHFLRVRQSKHKKVS